MTALNKIKIVFVFLMICCFASFAYAIDVPLSWDAVSSADGYKVYQTDDIGVTWTMVADVTETNTTILNVPDTGLVLFRVSAYNSGCEVLRSWSGAWANKMWDLDSPSGAGVQ